MTAWSVRLARDDERAALAAICAEAFAPIHAGFREALGAEVFALHYADWPEGYVRQLAAAALDAEAETVLVAEGAGTEGAAEPGAGFVLLRADARTRVGTIELAAVRPSRQGRGAMRALGEAALAWFAARGMGAAGVGTGLDPNHAPARAAYRALGFERGVPYVWLMRPL